MQAHGVDERARGSEHSGNFETGSSSGEEINNKQSIKFLSDRLAVLTKRLKISNLSKAQKIAIRKEQNAIRQELRERIKPHYSQELIAENDVDADVNAINQSMTMAQAKQMVQRAFMPGDIQERYDGEYKTAKSG